MNTVKNARVLREELALPAYSAMTDAEALAALNASSIPAAQPIQKSAIREYLRVTGSWLQLKRSTSDAAELAMDSINEDGAYDTGSALVLAKLTEVLDGVAADGAVPAFLGPNRDAILAFGQRLITRAEELQLGHVRLGHITQARANS
mgnify:CR=1 FL=1